MLFSLVFFFWQDNDTKKREIDELNLNILDVAPGLEVMEGIVTNKLVLFSVPRMDSMAALQEDYDVKSKPDLAAKIGSDKVLAQNCVRSLFTCGANYHVSHGRIIKKTLTEIGQMGIAACVNLSAELLGFGSNDGGTRRGLLAGRVSQRRSLSNERKHRLNGEDGGRATKVQRTESD